VLGLAATASAQSYPDGPVKLIVPFGAGGPLDMVGRSLSDKLAASLKQPVIIENRVGAGGNIGTEAAAKSVPDGYTLLLVLSGTLTANPAVFGKLPFDPERDFEPISLALLREHERDDAIPTNGRFIYYELEQRGVIPKYYLDENGRNRAHSNLVGGRNGRRGLCWARLSGDRLRT
jgi:Tripartite tricarboxylate transporter family receptor